MPDPNYDRLPAIEIHSHIGDRDGINLMRRERLTYALIMDRDNRAVLQTARDNRDLVGALIWVNPTIDGWLDETGSLLEKYSDVVRGFKLLPDGDRYTVSLDLLGPLFELAGNRRLMVQSHTAAPGDGQAGRCNAALFDPILSAFPQTVFIAIHGFPAAEAFSLVNKHPNAHIDTSHTAWGRDYQQRALAAVGRTKILMGLDSPLGFPYDNGRIQPHFRDAIGEIAAFYDHDRDVVEHVMYKNAARILKFDIPDAIVSR